MPDDVLLTYVVSFLVFAVFGSFFNVVIYRLPLMMESAWRRECELLLETPGDGKTDSNFNIAIPNSHCPSCKAHIKAWHNIPVLSYVLLLGRCANCKTGISLRYPVIELSTALLGVLCLYLFGLGPYGFATAAFCWTLLILTFIDFDHQLLPDQLTLPLMWAGLLLSALSLSPVSLEDAVWGAAAAYMTLWSV